MADFVDTIGRYGRGNIDLNNRIVVHNPDGSISTERSFSTNIDGLEVLLPTVINGVIVSEDEAIDYYFETGQYLGKFNTVEEAEEYAERLHERQDWYYNRRVQRSVYFEINGTDISKYIQAKGIKWTRNDIDSAKAGRNLAGTMNRGRVCMKVKLEVKLIPMKQYVATRKPVGELDVTDILNLINPEYVILHYADPLFGERSVKFYSNNVPATVCVEDSDGDLLWDEISFPLVER